MESGVLMSAILGGTIYRAETIALSNTAQVRMCVDVRGADGQTWSEIAYVTKAEWDDEAIRTEAWLLLSRKARDHKTQGHHERDVEY